MTPGDLVLFTQGWNQANGSGEPEAMTPSRYAELAERYG